MVNNGTRKRRDKLKNLSSNVFTQPSKLLYENVYGDRSLLENEYWTEPPPDKQKYEHIDCRWKILNLCVIYGGKPPSDLRETAWKAVTRAFHTWEDVGIFSFRFDNENLPQIRVNFKTGVEPLYGPGDYVAIGHYPFPYLGSLAGDILIDSAEPWSNEGNPDDGRIDLETVILHEIGHALGIGHSYIGESVMSTPYFKLRRKLFSADIEELGRKYGDLV